MSQNAKNIITRLKKSVKVKTDKMLCEMLGIKQNTLSTWKKRDTLDFNKIMALCDEKKINLDYVFFGIASKPDEKNYRPTNKISDKVEPKVNIFQEFKLVNSNRNLILFQTSMECFPKIKKDTLVVGQKIRKKEIAESIPYILQLKKIGFVVDELVQSSEPSLTFKLKYCQLGIQLIDPFAHIKNIWQVIDIMDGISIIDTKEDIFEST